MQADEVAADSDDDPEELLAHPDHAANPGEEGQWLNVEFGLRLHNFSVKVYEQTKSIRPGVKRHLCSFVPSTFILLKSVIYLWGIPYWFAWWQAVTLILLVVNQWR